ncbi:MAG: Ppx/GppA phosphatase family protein [Rhodospirillales bacterium]
MSEILHSGPVFGAIDLGTNNCRLLVARPNPRAAEDSRPSPQDSGPPFTVIGSFSRIVRLGEGLHAGGELSEAAMARAVSALGICARVMRRHGVTRARCIATEACRRAANADEFLDRVALKTGLMFETVSADEEARLTLEGCRDLIDPARRHALVFDIGGGSTEVMWVGVDEGAAELRLTGVLSIPLGVVTMAERLAAQHGGEAPDPLPAAAYEDLVREVDGWLAPFDAHHGISAHAGRGAVSLLGASGTITTLGGVSLDLRRYDRARVDGLAVKTPELRALAQRIAAMDLDARRNIGCIGADRADLMVMGCAVLEALCRRWPADTVRAADRSLREGLLSGMAADHFRAQSRAGARTGAHAGAARA